jgi:hypothetical protein
MNVLFREKIKVLAERNGWSLEHAKGFVDGETLRRRGKTLSKLNLIGFDEYCQGFRAGYFERQHPASARSMKLEAPGRVAGFAQPR